MAHCSDIVRIMEPLSRKVASRLYPARQQETTLLDRLLRRKRHAQRAVAATELT